MPQEQIMSEEFDPNRTVRKLHMRQREFMTQPQLPTTSFPEIGQHQGHLVNYGAFIQETPKPQRERKEKRKTIQSNARNTLVEPLEENFIHPKRSTVSMRTAIYRRKREPIRFNIIHVTTFGGTG